VGETTMYWGAKGNGSLTGAEGGKSSLGDDAAPLGKLTAGRGDGWDFGAIGSRAARAGPHGGIQSQLWKLRAT
jgi:hypothetical protein